VHHKADTVVTDLLKLKRGDLDDMWSIYAINQFPWPHQLAVAVPYNPKDPMLILDPWKNKFEAIYPKSP
jgi:hypothetical protein